LLGPADPPPVDVIEGSPKSEVMLICDHASAALPKSLGTLGLTDSELGRHIAIDIGAAPLTRNLADHFKATAVLAGDALQTFAFGLLASEAAHPDPAVRVRLIASLAKAAGVEGMVLGQALDIAAETAGRALTLDEITALQAGKTGALIGWAAEAGAVLAGEDPAPLARYAAALGLAFQIADDILDVEGDEAKAGKRLKKDADAGKATFVSHLGLDGAKARAAELVAEAGAALALYGERGEILRGAARFVIERDL